ncbi:sensor histidine kinase [Sciscionella marina]|uniref:sensor histidine kinase n=1 Tax=Sciscionella marina TaxID=508770 RepID=UPI00036B2659|nr:histidine kinase [Sciscionella marina]
MPVDTALEAVAQRPLQFLGSSWPWRAVLYVLGGVPLAIGTIMLTTAVSGGTDNEPLFYGLAAALILLSCLFGGRVERLRNRLVDRVPLPRPDRLGLRELGYIAVSALALYLIDVMLGVILFGIPVLCLSMPWQPNLLLAIRIVGFPIGLFLLPLAAYALTAWAGARAAMTRAILAPGEAELGEVLRSRARLVDVFEAQARRIERDLHDGAQQRLVALTVKLGLAKLGVPQGSTAARDLDEAHEQAKLALAEIRELIRGVHPQVLTDRGLPAAVQDIAGRSPVPVEVALELGARLPVPVEVAAYYVVSEALTNVAKHSAASRCWVHGELHDSRLRMIIGDDGVGGADPQAGTGITGLGDRVAVAGGTLALHSPRGGPTELRMEIPCA